MFPRHFGVELAVRAVQSSGQYCEYYMQLAKVTEKK
jgi:hypothetical protein